MAQIFPIDFEEKLTMAQDDYILFSDSEDGNKIKKAQYSNLKWEKWDTWEQWPQGIQGIQWPQGEQWIQWPQGEQWIQGIQWETWATWARIDSAAFSGDDIVFWETDGSTVTLANAKTTLTWPQWPQGEQGETWATGATGATWPQWPTWATGNWISTITETTSGKIHTVEITETNWNTTTFTVSDGADGEGAWDVIWPNSAVDGNVALFDGNTGKIIKDGWALPSVIDNLTSTSTTDVLSANQWKVLNDKIATLQARWRFLSNWNASTWLPVTFPEDTPYTYKTWDYFDVTVVWATNYKPNWSSYTWTASSTVETDALAVWDAYVYDGSAWLLQLNHNITTTFATISWQPTDNANLATALWGKQDTLVSWTNIKTVNSTSLLGSWNVAVQPTLVSGTNIKTVNSTSLLWSGDIAVQPTLVSGTNIKTVGGESLLWSGNVSVWVTSVNGNSWAVTVDESVVSWDSGTTYTIKKTSAAPTSATNTTITFVV